MRRVVFSELSDGKVAFKAFLTKSIIGPLPGQQIVFDDVRFNVGQAYNVVDGTFVAPCDGTYQFTVHVCSFFNRYIVLDLLQQGTVLSMVLAGDDAFTACASTTSIAIMLAGEDVTVKHHGSLGDYIFVGDGHHVSFEGVRLY